MVAFSQPGKQHIWAACTGARVPGGWALKSNAPENKLTLAILWTYIWHMFVRDTVQHKGREEGNMVGLLPIIQFSICNSPDTNWLFLPFFSVTKEFYGIIRYQVTVLFFFSWRRSFTVFGTKVAPFFGLMRGVVFHCLSFRFPLFACAVIIPLQPTAMIDHAAGCSVRAREHIFREGQREACLAG
jgi:hypothetical protein